MDAKKSFLRSGGEIAVISFVKPMYNVLYKMFGKVAVNEWVVDDMESGSQQYTHLSSALILNLWSYFFFVSILCRNLKRNSPNLFSLQFVLTEL